MRNKELSKRYGTKYISPIITKLKNTSVILSIGIVLCTATVLASTPQQAFSVTFGPTKNLSNDPSFNVDPRMAASGNSVYVVWAGLGPSGDQDVFSVASTD